MLNFDYRKRFSLLKLTETENTMETFLVFIVSFLYLLRQTV